MTIRRFWNASGVSVKLGGAGVEVQVESLRALLLGGIAFDTPTPQGQSGAQASAANHVFPLFADREAADAAVYGRKLHVRRLFPRLGPRPGTGRRRHLAWAEDRRGDRAST